jgi:hypothetical protein
VDDGGSHPTSASKGQIPCARVNTYYEYHAYELVDLFILAVRAFIVSVFLGIELVARSKVNP